MEHLLKFGGEKAVYELILKDSQEMHQAQLDDVKKINDLQKVNDDRKREFEEVMSNMTGHIFDSPPLDQRIHILIEYLSVDTLKYNHNDRYDNNDFILGKIDSCDENDYIDEIFKVCFLTQGSKSEVKNMIFRFEVLSGMMFLESSRLLNYHYHRNRAFLMKLIYINKNITLIDDIDELKIKNEKKFKDMKFVDEKIKNFCKLNLEKMVSY